MRNAAVGSRFGTSEGAAQFFDQGVVAALDQAQTAFRRTWLHLEIIS